MVIGLVMVGHVVAVPATGGSEAASADAATVADEAQDSLGQLPTHLTGGKVVADGDVPKGLARRDESSHSLSGASRQESFLSALDLMSPFPSSGDLAGDAAGERFRSTAVG